MRSWSVKSGCVARSRWLSSVPTIFSSVEMSPLLVDVQPGPTNDGPDAKRLKEKVHGLDSSTEFLEESFRIVDFTGKG